MVEQTTVEPPLDEAADIAPGAPHPSPLPQVGKTPAPQMFEGDGKKSRHKTSGETIFDLATYGGLSLAGNEVLSTFIVKQGTEGHAKKYYAPVEKWVKNLKPLNKLEYFHSGRAPVILLATIGGWFLVPPVKFMEDRKAGIVRWLDNKLHHNTASQQEMDQAHAEMDKAPKQSWRSLWEGRVVTVGAALLVDSIVGWPQSVSAKLFDKTKLKDYGSYDRTITTVVRKVVNFFDKPGAAGRIAARDPKAPYHIAAGEGKVTSIMALGLSLLSLSTILTVLFYASSKAFAHGQEQKAQQKLANPGNPARDEAADTSIDATPAQPGAPTTRVAQVENLSRMAAMPEHSMATVS